jgi:hypothetical protein
MMSTPAHIEPPGYPESERDGLEGLGVRTAPFDTGPSVRAQGCTMSGVSTPF